MRRTGRRMGAFLLSCAMAFSLALPAGAVEPEIFDESYGVVGEVSDVHDHGADDGHDHAAEDPTGQQEGQDTEEEHDYTGENVTDHASEFGGVTDETGAESENGDGQESGGADYGNGAEIVPEMTDLQKPETATPQDASRPAGDVPAGAPGMDEPGVEADIMLLSAASVPKIEVKAVDGRTCVYDGLDYYCAPPTIKVTNETGQLKKLVIQWTVGTGKQEDEIPLSGSSFTYEMQGKAEQYKNRVCYVWAENDIGSSAIATFYVGHFMGGRQSYIVDADCTNPQRKVNQVFCRACGCIYDSSSKDVEGSSALGHDWGDSVTRSICDGSDTSKTVEVRICKRCGAWENYSFDDSGHEWEDKRKDATCVVNGADYQECRKCKAIRNIKPILALGHNYYDSWQVTQKAECSAEHPDQKGVETQICRVCKEPGETRTIQPTHTWGSRYPESKVVTKEASCTETGDFNYVCIYCKKVMETHPGELPALGHTVKSDGNCTTDDICEVCQTIVTPKQSSHTLGWESDSSGHWKKCKNPSCTYTEQKASHSASITSGTCREKRTCVECGYTIPASPSHKLEYRSDDVHHWKVCTNPGCTYQEAEEAHKGMSEGNCLRASVCSVCNRVLREAKSSHNFSGEWKIKGISHYHICTNPGCTVVSDMEAHTYSGWTGNDCTQSRVCDVCGNVAEQGKASHRFSQTYWYSDSTSHWKECINYGCKVTTDRLAHVEGNIPATCTTQAVCKDCNKSFGALDPSNHTGPLELTNVTNPTKTSPGYSGDIVCRGCGKVKTYGHETPKLTEHDHIWEKKFDDVKSWMECSVCGSVKEETPHKLSEWYTDANVHWQRCDTCDYTTTKAPHVVDLYDNDCTTAEKCKICGYVVAAASGGHNYGGAYLYDQNGHWQACQNKNCQVIGGKSSHTMVDDGNCLTAVACSVCGYTAAGKLSQHNWSGIWETDDANVHYQTCTNEGCRQRLEAAHVASVDDGLCTTVQVCTICNRVMAEGQAQHNFSGGYYADAGGHWRVCVNAGCTARGPESNHTGGTATCAAGAVCETCGHNYGEKNPQNHAGAEENRGYIAPTTEKAGYSGDYYCLSCGQIKTAGKVLPRLSADHKHSFVLIGSDSGGHWKECACGVRDGYTAHSADKYVTDQLHHEGVCRVCGHPFGGEHTAKITYDQKGHWNICAVCGAAMSEAESHTFMAGKCTVCGMVGTSGGGSSGSSGSSSGGGSGGGGGGSRKSGTGGPLGSGAPANLPSYVVQGNWIQNGDTWKFTDSNGQPYVNRWAAVYNPYAHTAEGQSSFDWFWFDEAGNMLTGWHKDADGNDYYLNPASDGTRGRMVTGWAWIKGDDGKERCYYFNPVSDGTRGKLMRNTVIDGFQIDANGYWVVNGIVQTR